MKDLSGIEIAPCIVAKARQALELSQRRPINVKKCSFEYWVRAIDVVAHINQIRDRQRITAAYGQYENLITNYIP